MKKRSTLWGEIAATIPRFTASSANSRGVQWSIGRSDTAGGSQATATIAHTCSGVHLAGAPDRGSSARTLGVNEKWTRIASSKKKPKERDCLTEDVTQRSADAESKGDE